LAGLVVVRQVLRLALPKALAGAVANIAAPLAARPIRRKSPKPPTRVASASTSTGSPAMALSRAASWPRTADRTGASSVLECIVTGSRPRLPPVIRTSRWTHLPSDQVRYTPTIGLRAAPIIGDPLYVAWQHRPLCDVLRLS